MPYNHVVWFLRCKKNGTILVDAFTVITCIQGLVVHIVGMGPMSHIRNTKCSRL